MKLNQDLATRATKAQEWLSMTEAERVQHAQSNKLTSAEALMKTKAAEAILIEWLTHRQDEYINF